VPDQVTLWGLRLNITQNFDQWANVRPVHFHPGVVSPLRKADDTHLDWVVVRENSEGEYAGLGGRNLSARGPGNEVALQTALFTEQGCERIIRFAFDLARTRRVKKVSSVTKSNAQPLVQRDLLAAVVPVLPLSWPPGCAAAGPRPRRILAMRTGSNAAGAGRAGLR
jgi:isocitrate/isopropylmalate dehydrogenase